ncbi:MAG: FkbM family methyltransferase [Bacteriovoracaceae bacterium]
MINVKHMFKDLLRKTGFDVIKYNHASHPLARRMFLINKYKIDLVIDVGANTGQFGTILRRAGYTKKIVSFEPLSEAFSKLKKNTKTDLQWEVHNYGLGNKSEKVEINVANNSQSSSILSMLDSHINAAPESKYIKKETIKIETLDNIFDEIAKKDNRIYLKVDTQGFEKQVVEGVRKNLNKITGIQLELSLIPLYAGEDPLQKMVTFMDELGFTLMNLEPGFANPESGQLLQVDGIFFRESENSL